MGVTFTNAFGEGLPTIPARRAFFTGFRSFPWRYRYETKGIWPSGQGWHQIPEDQETLSETLLKNGYETGLISDTYHMFKPTMNFTRGFSSYEFIRGNENDNYRNGEVKLSDLSPYVRIPSLKMNASLAQYIANTKERKVKEDWNVSKVFDKSINWISRRNKNKPFFLWIDSYTPHEPWDPLKVYTEKHWIKNVPIPEKKFIFPIGMKEEDFESETEIEFVKALYLGCVSMVDEALGNLLTFLKESGEIDNTLIVLISDHGTELMDHGQFSKSSNRLYTHNTRIVFSLAGPDIPKGNKENIIQAHDLNPTILDYVGIKYVKKDGTNLVPLLNDHGSLKAREYATIGWGSNISIRSAQWNYFINVENGSNEVLFDLYKDPMEKNNIANENTKMARYFKNIVEEFLESKIPYKFPEKFSQSIAPFRYYYNAIEKKYLPDWDSGFG